VAVPSFPDPEHPSPWDAAREEAMTLGVRVLDSQGNEICNYTTGTLTVRMLYNEAGLDFQFKDKIYRE